MKMKPVEVEMRFQELKGQLVETKSIRLRYRLFREFVMLFRGNYKLYESYLIESISELPEFYPPVTWTGMRPEELESYLDLLADIQNNTGRLKNDKWIIRIMNRLYQACIMMYACLNDFDSIDTNLNHLLKTDSGFIAFCDRTKDVKPYGIYALLQFIDELFLRDESWQAGWYTLLQPIKDDCTGVLRQKNGTVLVPVVERYILSDGHEQQCGRLRRLSVVKIGEHHQHDELTWELKLFGAEMPNKDYYPDSAEAARKEALTRTGQLKNKFFKGIISYELTGAEQKGKSANLAIAALWYSILLKEINLREQYKVNSSAAITGDIDPDGNVIPVDPASIDLKIKGAFFSWCSCLVVPLQQIHEFEKARNNLSKEYPHRKLELVPAERLEEVFFDRRAAYYMKTGRIAYAVQNAWKKRYSLVSLTSIAILITIIIGLIYSPINKNPAGFFFQGEYLVLTNSNGLEITRIKADSETADYQNINNNHSGKPLVVLFDITGDGVNDVIWATRGNWISENTSEIQAYSVAGDSIIWHNRVKQDYVFPRQSAYLQTGLRANKIGIIRISDEDIRLITNHESGIYFPALIKSINIKTGEVLSEYLHVGSISDMQLVDLTGNGVQEIVLTGVNNAYWNAFIAVLDPLQAHGHSPLTPDYQPSGIDQASELFYMLVPKTIIAEYVNPVEKYNLGIQAFYDSISQRISFIIVEGHRYFRGFEGHVQILLYLDREFRPAGVGTNDLYDIVARELYEEGEIPFIPDYEYFKAFQDSMLFWNGQGFVGMREYFGKE